MDTKLLDFEEPSANIWIVRYLISDSTIPISYFAVVRSAPDFFCALCSTRVPPADSPAAGVCARRARVQTYQARFPLARSILCWSHTRSERRNDLVSTDRSDRGSRPYGLRARHGELVCCRVVNPNVKVLTFVPHNTLYYNEVTIEIMTS